MSTARTAGSPGAIARYIARRLAVGLLVLFVVSLVIFAVTQLLPTDPAETILGREATPESLTAFRRDFGLTRSRPAQYLSWFGGVLHGDFGRSFTTRLPVSGYIGARVVASLFLLCCAGLVAIPLGVLLGAWAALRRDRAFDRVSSFVTLIVASVPEFVVGAGLVILLATNVFHVLPAIYYLSPDDPPWSNMKGIVLPVLALAISVIPYVARATRGAVAEVLESDYIEMARLKGMPERAVLWRHALPNALGPVFQVIALNLAFLAGGVIVIELLFNYPGVGSALAEGVRARDLPTVQFLALFVATVYVVTNLLADIATVLCTPRLRTALR